ncbi:recombinase family protein [Afipia birgiae]|uniref:recombinase family protein n=1 Tax=Afipia birgiae TaxID=151414 RepID=UPI0002FBE582|nr:recombinase family protein [Afipia birgiae]
MASNSPKTLRCAIYTRKSTEHGLELEFNSLDAQREACEAYIKSQASQGWKALPQLYDDPAFSGGNLERPALKRLLADIEAHRVDVVVVYKIDRLTRSLADFAKLVEAFDARSISFVAVTQQFNTTTSMGRLTLNVLLSFAQFERELSSERVRDKIAASRAKGKWTGGNVPFGYKTHDKKLVIHEPEAETIQFIFKRYLELGSFEPLVLDLDAKGIRSRVKKSKGSDTHVASRFTYGPLAYLLNNRIYVGQVSHKGKWHPGEHTPIIDAKLFDAVQMRLSANKVIRKNRRSESGALLMGKLFDDRDNRMSPSYSTKKGVRYRFYVSAALLRGRKAAAGSLSRISAMELEATVLQAVRMECGRPDPIVTPDAELIEIHVERVVVSKNAITIVFPPQLGLRALTIPWVNAASGTTSPKYRAKDNSEADPVLVHAIARAHARIKDLEGGRFDTVEALAASAKAHSKMLRQELRLAFLAPDILTAMLQGDQPAGLTLTAMLPTLPLSWAAQRRAIGLSSSRHSQIELCGM